MKEQDSMTNTVHMTLYGNVPSKKNNKQIIYRNGRPLIISSKSHKEWHEDASNQLLGCTKINTKIHSVMIEFYLNGKYKTDLTNKAESIMDLLVDCGIIEDDNCFVVPEVHLFYEGIDKLNPRAEVYIHYDV